MINRFTDEYGWLSNFSQHHIEVDGAIYQTVEHYYQAQKAVTDEDFIKIAAADTPGKAKRLGAKLTFANNRLKPDWYNINIEIMMRGLYAKFTQHPKLMVKLIETGDEEIIEGNDWGDTFWGAVDGRGQNHLGKLLMQLREELKEL